MWLSHESAHAYEKLRTKYAGGREADRNCRRLCSRRSPAAHLGALRRGDPPFARAVSQSAPNCPAPTEIPRTQAWPHAQPSTLTSRSRPCPLWPPLRTGRGWEVCKGRGRRRTRLRGAGSWGWCSGLQLRHRGLEGASQEEAPNRVLPGGVVMCSSARISREEINRHLLR